jgi:hypothetical protein
VTNFDLEVEIMPDSAKTCSLDLHGLKLMLRLDILFALQDFFYDAMPAYDGLQEQPSGFETDRNNDPRLEFSFTLRESLVCFEQK